MMKKKLVILLITILTLALSTSIVSAKASSVIITGKDGKYYEYNYTDLKSSASASVLGDTDNGALYENFIKNKVSVAAYYDDVRKVYVSTSVINEEAVLKVTEGKTFDFTGFLENTNTATTSIATTKVTKDNLNVIGNTDTSVVNFKSKALESRIRAVVHKPTGDIYKGDVEKIIMLYADNYSIQDLSGIENLTNLKYLSLSTTNISDISLLKSLTRLEELNLDCNQINDIGALKNLTNLKKLNLANNLISDTSSLRGLTNLQELYIGGNQLSNDNVQSLKNALPKVTIN